MYYPNTRPDGQGHRGFPYDLLTDPLSEEQLAERDEFIVTASLEKLTHPHIDAIHFATAEQKQVESDIAHLTRAKLNAVGNGEPVTSLYIRELESKLGFLTERQAELEILLAGEGKQVA